MNKTDKVIDDFVWIITGMTGLLCLVVSGEDFALVVKGIYEKTLKDSIIWGVFGTWLFVQGFRNLRLSFVSIKERIKSNGK